MDKIKDDTALELLLEQRNSQALALANTAYEREYYKRLYEGALKELEALRAPADPVMVPPE